MSVYQLLYVLLHLETRDYAMAVTFVDAMQLVPLTEAIAMIP